MTQLTNNQELKVSAGDYVVVTSMSSGTSKLQISVDQGTTYVDITDASWSATATAVITLPQCMVKCVLTGDADLFLLEQSNAQS